MYRTRLARPAALPSRGRRRRSLAAARSSTALAVAAAGVLLAAVQGSAAAQGVPSRSLGKPEVEYEEPFTIISGLRELRDGRVIVSDVREKTVQLVDLDAGTAQKVGREGQGPGEYSLPMSLYALPGDSTALYDALNRRFLVILPTGKAGGTFTLGQDDNAGQVRVRPGMRLGFQQPRGVDRRGRLYFQAAGVEMTPEGPKSADSAAILRYDRATKRIDTIGYVRIPEVSVRMSTGGGGAGGGAGGQRRTMAIAAGGGDPFAPQDAWVVAPDGSIAIVHADEYRVTWVSPDGRRASGPAVPYQRIKVTEADKKAWREGLQRGGGGIMITHREGAGGRASEAITSSRLPEPEKWSEYKPPFAASGVLAAHDGSVWVLRHRAASDDTPTYDVFDGRGRLVGKVVLPERTRVVGFGEASVYLARSDEDDLQYLQRYRISGPVVDR